RVEFTLNRETLERALGELPYQAFRQNRDFIITPAKLSADSAETELFALRDPANKAMTEIQVETPLLMTAAQLPLPEGWVVDVEDPIIYRSTGLCSGGELKLKVGAVLYEYDLAAPRCQPILK
ncbi:MAG: hypothetical protein JNK21_14525, partial [Rhodospirillaceae bacterium]|nr:hypothetical protein [Rhodospirillaceae bacterium]